MYVVRTSLATVGENKQYQRNATGLAMSLLDEEDIFDHEPAGQLKISTGAANGEEPRGKEKREKKKVGGITLGRPKPKELQTEKTPKKGKHVRTKSGSRTPPDSPRAGWGSDNWKGGRVGGAHSSPNVKTHRKRYSQLGLDECSLDSPEEEARTGYFANQAITDASTDHSSSSPEIQEPFFSIENHPQVAAIAHRPTTHFPVQFAETTTYHTPWFPLSSLETHPLVPGEPLPPHSDSLSTHPQPSPWPLPTDTPADSAPLGPVDSAPSGRFGDEVCEVPDSELRLSNELRLKCRKQFLDLKPTNGRLQGDQARSFFIQSHLPNSELSTIWRLADMDKDNALSEEEFCVAMKLVLLRRKGYRLPSSLPDALRSAEGTRQPTAAHPHSPPILKTQSAMEIVPPPSSKQQLLAGILHQSTSDMLTNSLPSSLLGEAETATPVAATQLQPTVPTIISLDSEDKEQKEEEEEEGEDDSTLLFQQAVSEHRKPTRPAPIKESPSSAHKLKTLKQFPAASTSPEPRPVVSQPESLFPHASDDIAPIIMSGSTPTFTTTPHKASYSAKGEEREEKDRVGVEPFSWTLLAREHGHSRSSSLDLNKMMQAAAASVYSDVPSAEPPKPPPKPSSSQEDSEVVPQMRGRSASTGSISSTGPCLPTPKDLTGDSSARALLLSGVQLRRHSPFQPVRKAPLPSASPKPSRPPPPTRRVEQESRERLPEGPSVLRDKGELQNTIRSLKETNAILQAVNKELEEKLFALMEERVQLARELELAKQMQST